MKNLLVGHERRTKRARRPLGAKRDWGRVEGIESRQRRNIFFFTVVTGSENVFQTSKIKTRVYLLVWNKPFQFKNHSKFQFKYDPFTIFWSMKEGTKRNKMDLTDGILTFRYEFFKETNLLKVSKTTKIFLMFYSK